MSVKREHRPRAYPAGRNLEGDDDVQTRTTGPQSGGESNEREGNRKAQAGPRTKGKGRSTRRRRRTRHRDGEVPAPAQGGDDLKNIAIGGRRGGSSDRFLRGDPITVQGAVGSGLGAAIGSQGGRRQRAPPSQASSAGSPATRSSNTPGDCPGRGADRAGLGHQGAAPATGTLASPRPAPPRASRVPVTPGRALRRRMPGRCRRRARAEGCGTALRTRHRRARGTAHRRRRRVRGLPLHRRGTGIALQPAAEGRDGTR